MLKRQNQNNLFHILELNLELFFLAFGGFLFVTGLAFIILKIKIIIFEYDLLINKSNWYTLFVFIAKIIINTIIRVSKINIKTK
jgi:hypothetical protein